MWEALTGPVTSQKELNRLATSDGVAGRKPSKSPPPLQIVLQRHCKIGLRRVERLATAGRFLY